MGAVHFGVVYLISPLVMTSFCAVYLIDVETGIDVLPAFSTAVYATHAFRMVGGSRQTVSGSILKVALWAGVGDVRQQ